MRVPFAIALEQERKTKVWCAATWQPWTEPLQTPYLDFVMLAARYAALLFLAGIPFPTGFYAQALKPPALPSVPLFQEQGLESIASIQQRVSPAKPLTVTGARGAILGEQSGVIELWQLPVKVFSNLHVKAQLDGYTVPIELNTGAATLQVWPGHTVLTYSFAGITLRQHMLVSPAVPAGGTPLPFDDPGAIVYFQVDAVRPAVLTFTLTPNLQQEWPAPQYGIPGAGWVSMAAADAPEGYPGGAYALSTDNPALFGMIGMPNSRAGDIPVYQEHPQTLPLQFQVRFDPLRDKDRLFPLLSTVSRPGERNSTEAFAAMQQRLAKQAKDLPSIAAAIDGYYAHFFDTRLTVSTPDPRFDEALRWAALSMEDAQVEHRTGSGQSETGLVAGWFGSYDSARPGFGWYFGRDTLWSLYAIDSDGDTALAKRALEFLLHRQRGDGKMMHEFSQMADALPPNLPWDSFPYEYAAADATPLFLLAMRDYLRTSGDTAFLAEHYDAVKRAWNFECTHDSDGDGVYDNSQGTGWVENWQSPMPHQELYLAALDAKASLAMANLAELQHDDATVTQARTRAVAVARVVETYRDPTTGLYAFSKNADGSFDRTVTVYPSVALWQGREARQGQPCQQHGGTPMQDPCDALGLQQAGPMLNAWSSPLLATDWGTRAIATTTSFYDPISYHMGSVWPLFTGWNAMAQYHAGRPVAGWLTLQQNLRLTWAEDPGTVTELLSGAYYQPLGRSSAHQLWSSAMVLAPAVRGLFGVEADATRDALDVRPQLPVTWDHAGLNHVRVGGTLYTVTLDRTLQGKHPAMKIVVTSAKPTGLCLNLADGAVCSAKPAMDHESVLALPVVEAGLHTLPEPQPGDATHLPHITEEAFTDHGLKLTVEATGGSTVLFDVRRNGSMDPEPTAVHMPAGAGYVKAEVAFDLTK